MKKTLTYLQQYKTRRQQHNLITDFNALHPHNRRFLLSTLHL